jgi:hypothetical protein
LVLVSFIGGIFAGEVFYFLNLSQFVRPAILFFLPPLFFAELFIFSQKIGIRRILFLTIFFTAGVAR